MHCSKRIIFLKKMKSPLCPWHVAYFHPDQEDPRPSHSVPSIHHQTLLSKSIFEHCLDYAQVASIAMASKSIQNSSLSANFAHNVVIEAKSVKLFNSVFHPSTSIPLTFVPALRVDVGPEDHSYEKTCLAPFLDALKNTTTTKY